MDIPCECQAYQDDIGQMVCRKCKGDWYACDCFPSHTRKCSEAHIREAELKGAKSD